MYNNYSPLAKLFKSAEYNKLKSEHETLKTVNAELFAFYQEVIQWGKTKDGKFTYVTSESSMAERTAAINNAKSITK